MSNKKGEFFLADIHPEHAHIIEQTKANMPSEEILEKTAGSGISLILT